MLPTNGEISTILKTIYTVPSKKIGYITNIKLNNKNNTDWNIELYQFDHNTGKSILLYKYELEAGKMINDSMEYRLPARYALQAKSSVSSAVYVINGYEVDTST